MRKITRKEWIEALKSGEYKQTKNYLYSNGSFCCLGVACDLAGLPYAEEDGGISRVYGLPGNVPSRLMIYGDIVPMLGLVTNDVDLDPGMLSNLNDSGMTFEQIADLLIFDTWARGLEQEQ